MKKRAFTLIEVLAIIIVLGILVSITAPSLFNTVQNAKEKSYNVLMSTIKNNAKVYVTKNVQDVENNIATEGFFQVSLLQLIDQGLLKEKVVNPKTNENIDTNKKVIVTRDEQEVLVYCFEDDCPINIYDKTSPVITIIGGDITVPAKTSYTDAGATASDNIDGDITSHIVVQSNVNTNMVGDYTVTYTVSDSHENATTAIRNVYVRDTGSPVITILGNNPETIGTGLTYTDAGATASDAVDGNLTSKIQITNGVPTPTQRGTFFVNYSVQDASHNVTTAQRPVNVIDINAPILHCVPPGGATYAQSWSSAITVTDADGTIVANSLKYQWTTSQTAPTEASFSTTFTNGATITTPGGVNGTYYLWVIGKDNSNNTMIASCPAFYLDNMIPTVTYTPGSNATCSQTQTSTVTVADAHSGVKGSTLKYQWLQQSTPAPIEGTYPTSFTSGSGVTSPSNITGNYYLWIYATDNANNIYNNHSTGTFAIDNTDPTVVFGTNGSPIIAKSRSTTVTVSDVGCGLLTGGQSTLKYQWLTTTTTPLEGSFVNTFANGGTITSPAAVTGTYYLWILAKDGVGNTTISRTNGFVLDNTAPVITIIGSNPITVYSGTTYTDAGALGNDNNLVEGILTSSIQVTNPIVSPTEIGTYEVIYRLSDTAGNVAVSKTRTVNVVQGDFTPPTIAFGTSGSATCSKSGSSKITATDASGIDTTSLKYQWNTDPNTPPTLNLSYTNGTSVSSTAGVSGTYYLWATAKDIFGNPTTPQPFHTGSFNLDNTPPTITVTGPNPATVELGSSYTDKGATAYDVCSGDITSSIEVSSDVTPNVLGVDHVTYDVADTAGNDAVQKIRTVNVTDTVPPVITWGTDGRAICSKIGSSTITATDVGGIVSSSLKYLWRPISSGTPIASDFGTTFTNTGTASASGYTGNYYLWAIAKDPSGNPKIDSTNAFYFDNTPPTITINGSATVTVQLGGSYTDAGATATDGCDPASPAVRPITDVNTNIVGSYTVDYSSTDTAGNTATATRHVNVIDTVPPKIAWGTDGHAACTKIGSSTITASDAGGIVGSSLKYLWWLTSNGTPIASDFGTAFTNGGTASASGLSGNYYLWATAKDPSNPPIIDNTNVFALDNTPPVITVTGSNPQTVTQGSSYVDSGATATDNCSGNITSAIIRTGSVNSLVAGTYIITYNVTDPAGNVGLAKTRTVNVIDNGAPVITWGTDGNATCSKTFSSTITASDSSGINASSLKYLWQLTSDTQPIASDFGTAFTNGGTASASGYTGNYSLWAIAKDNSANANTKIDSTGAFAFDNTGPTITITGTNPITVSSGSTYTDAGAKATDNCDTTAPSVLSSSDVNTNIPGTYHVTYNSEDTAGNSATTKTRTVNVIDDKDPTCTTSGGSSGWSKVNKTITISCSDTGGSGISTCNGDAASSSTETYSSNVNTTYTYTVVDKAGNTGTCTAQVKIDKTPPTAGTATFTNANGNPYLFDTQADNCGGASDFGGSSNGWTATSTVTAHLTDGSDALSGQTTTISPTTVSATGTHTVTITTTDGAGNTATRSCNIKIDRTDPTCSTSGDSSTWYTGSRTVSISCSDSGGAGMLTCNGDSGSSSSETYSSNTNTTYTYTARDRAGNTGTCTGQVRIDLNNPTCTTSGGSSSWYTSRTINVSCSDTGGSGMESCNTTPGSTHTYTYTTTTNGTLTYTAIDNAGRTGTCTAQVRVDKTAPNAPTWSANGSYYDANCGYDGQSGTPTYCLLICAHSAGYGTCTPSTQINSGWGCDSNSDCCAQTIDNIGNKSSTSCHIHF